MSGLSYRDAGVDIDAGSALVERVKPAARATARRGATAALGGFGALFDLKAAGFVDPLLIATTDGVGTKLKIAQAMMRHDTIGVDLVAMCVNDLIVQGAEPLFFLDYYATGRLSVPVAAQVIEGIARACAESGCALIGGETAEMPGLYQGEEYDLAGFAVGAVERGSLIDGRRVTAGDRVLGLASDGLHSNGFSLVRRVIAEAGLAMTGPAPFAAGLSLGEALLTPTRLYVRPLLALIASHPPGTVKALAHITGGGLVENIPRVLPDGMGVELDASAWPVPPVFRWLASAGRIAPAEMTRTFNCGIGMIAVVAPDLAGAVSSALAATGERVHALGTVVSVADGAPRVTIPDLAAAWS